MGIWVDPGCQECDLTLEIYGKRTNGYQQYSTNDGLLGGGCWWFEKEMLIFIPEMMQFDEHIFQMGWFNHQLVYKISPSKLKVRGG